VVRSFSLLVVGVPALTCPMCALFIRMLSSPARAASVGGMTPGRVKRPEGYKNRG
jgi:hypothetical protein